MGWKIHQGDCLEVLRGFDDNSIDSMVTDPPAGISFMAKGWDSDKGGRDKWIAWLAEIMAEALRVLRPGAHALVWAFDKTQHWTMLAIDDAGFEIRQVVFHVHGQGFPKSTDPWRLVVQPLVDEQLRKQGVTGEIKWR
jgi:site-specific DNA-methyltransferase (adenine-specific)